MDDSRGVSFEAVAGCPQSGSGGHRRRVTDVPLASLLTNYRREGAARATARVCERRPAMHRREVRGTCHPVAAALRATERETRGSCR
jgi:hypothetical protein